MSVVIKLGRVLPRRRTCARMFLSLVVVTGVVMALIPLQARAFEVIESDPHGQSGVTAPVMSVPSTPVDSCLYILKSARERHELSYGERQHRQYAGSAAAVGLVFGVRFALGPSEVNKNRKRVRPVAAFQVWEANDSSSSGGGQALAIAEYRSCRNEQALRALTD